MDEIIQYPAYVGDTTRLNQAIKRIARALLDYRAEFLFGAGMSVKSGVPAGSRLAVELLQTYFPAGTTDSLSLRQLAKLARE